MGVGQTFASLAFLFRKLATLKAMLVKKYRQVNLLNLKLYTRELLREKCLVEV